MMEYKKKLLIVSSLFPPHLGGVEQYTASLAAALAPSHEVTVVCLNTENQPACRTNSGYTVYFLPCFPAFGGRLPLPGISALKTFSSYCRQNAVDFGVIQTRLYPFNLWAARCFKRSRIPHILIEHGSGHIDYGSRVVNLLWKIYEHALTLGFRFFTQSYYGVSSGSLKWLAHFGIHGKGVLHNGITPDNFNTILPFDRKKFRIPSDAAIITFAGRIIREKGILVLLEAFSRWSPENVHLVIAGSGDMELVQRWRRNPSIHFAGQLAHPEILSLLSESSLFCLPTMYPEGLPTVLIEAGFLGKAVVTTVAGGIGDLVQDGESGRFVEAGNVDQLAAVLHDLMTDPLERDRLGNNLRQRVRTGFVWPEICLKLERIISEMCPEPADSRNGFDFSENT